MSQMLDYEQFDLERVDEFLDDFMHLTGHWFSHLQKRTQELDTRIRRATLSLADKIEVFKRLAPRAADSRLGAISDERKELRMERLLLSVAPEDLPLFKFALEYDGDYKDLLEEGSLKSLVEFTKERLCPSALSGCLFSSAAGTIQTWLRANLDLLSDEVPHGQEDKIGEVKFENFSRFSAVYPEYRYVFVGDSGQADALTAQLMVTKGSTEGTSRVVTTFIHNLKQSADDEKSVSPTFRNLPADVLIGRTSASGRGVIVFRNYIDAAIIAHMHSATLKYLVTAEGLAKVTRAALNEFQAIDFQGKEASRIRLQEQYRQDAEEAYKLLTMTPSRPSPLEDDMKEIRWLLDERF